MKPQKIFLIRHGETKWSLSGQHTGKTDLPLTEHGRNQAKLLSPLMQSYSFSKAFVSPLQRAQTTFELMDLKVPSVIDEDLYEWDYGKYEGITTAEIRKTRPNWSIFTDGVPDGESLEAVRARAEKVVAKVQQVDGDVILFSSGHFLRVLATAWLKAPLEFGAQIALGACSVSILGYEHEKPALLLWNGKQP